MTKTNLLKILIISLLLIFGCSNKQKNTEVKREISTAQKIANAAGIKKWDSVNSLAFTFNVKIGKKEIHRSWYWEPKNDIVKFYSAGRKDSTVFSHNQIGKNSSPEIIKRDKQFINDSYWLLFPFHLIWDKNVDISVSDSFSKLPIGKRQAVKVIVKYSADKGYTPNDVYDLYLDDNYKIIEWAYHKNNSPVPNRVTKWIDYKQIGGLNLSLNRPGKDDNFKVWFTDVTVK